MLNVGFKNTAPATLQRPRNSAQNSKRDNFTPLNTNKDFPVSFNGNINYVFINKITDSSNLSPEFKHISNVLKTIGVKELEIGDNLELARLLKSALLKIKKLGFDIPERIRCESEYFETAPHIKEMIEDFRRSYPEFKNLIVNAMFDYEDLSNPIIYLNTKGCWDSKNILAKINDPRDSIWHEVGHYLHFKNYKNDLQKFEELSNIQLNKYEKDIVRDTIGIYAADNNVNDAIAEIFSRFISGKSYDRLHPEIFNIYSKYKGPMPKAENMNALKNF